MKTNLLDEIKKKTKKSLPVGEDPVVGPNELVTGSKVKSGSHSCQQKPGTESSVIWIGAGYSKDLFDHEPALDQAGYTPNF